MFKKKQPTEFEKYVMKHEQEIEIARRRQLVKEQGVAPGAPQVAPPTPPSRPMPSTIPNRTMPSTIPSSPMPPGTAVLAPKPMPEPTPTPEPEMEGKPVESEAETSADTPKRKGFLGLFKKDKGATQQVDADETKADETASGADVVVEGLKQFANDSKLEVIELDYDIQGKEIIFKLSFSNKPLVTDGSDIKEVKAEPRYPLKKINYHKVLNQFVSNLKSVFEI